MRILLTNDDGYNAIGIRLVYEALKDKHDVTIVAPKFHQSGAGSSLSIRKPLRLEKEEEHIYSLTGTPSDCVKFAIKGMKLETDLVISGCNDGYNIGHDTNYSGTFGAAREGMFCKVRSIALSTKPGCFNNVKEQLEEVIKYIDDNNLLSLDYVLNVNFPGCKAKGIKESFIYDASHDDIYTLNPDGTYELDGEFKEVPLVGSDIDHLNQGYISISKLVPIRSVN